MKGKLMIFLRKYLTTISNSNSLFISSNPTNDPWKKTFCGQSHPLNKLLWRHWGLKFSPFSSRHTLWDNALKREIWLVQFQNKYIWERRTAVGSYTTMFSWFQQSLEKWWQRSLQSCLFFLHNLWTERMTSKVECALFGDVVSPNLWLMYTALSPRPHFPNESSFFANPLRFIAF